MSNGREASGLRLKRHAHFAGIIVSKKHLAVAWSFTKRGGKPAWDPAMKWKFHVKHQELDENDHPPPISCSFQPAARKVQENTFNHPTLPHFHLQFDSASLGHLLEETQLFYPYVCCFKSPFVSWKFLIKHHVKPQSVLGISSSHHLKTPNVS